MRPASTTVLPASSDVGRRLRQRREALRLSQREAAERIGVTARGYQRWESGESGITAENVGRVEEVLETTVDWLRMGDELGRLPEGIDFAVIRDGVVELLAEVKAPQGAVAERLAAMEERLGRIELVIENLAAWLPADSTRDAIDATRSAKEAASASAGAGARASEPAESARDEEGASPAAARAASGKRPRAPR